MFTLQASAQHGVVGWDAEGNAVNSVAGSLNAHHSSHRQPGVVSFDWQKGNDVENPRPSTMNVTEEQTGTLAATRVPAVLAFHHTQEPISSPERSPALGTTTNGMGVLSFSAKDSGADCAVELAPTLRAGTHDASHENGGVMPAIVAYDTTQVTSAANRSNPRAGDPCHPLAAAAHAPLVVSITGEVTHALTHEGHDASEDGTGRGTPIVALDVQNCLTSEDVFATLDSGAAHGNRGPQVHAGIPRRLMPIECERLMSWPDGWTDAPDAKGKPASDAARYKAAGNGVVSNVAQWIGERLAFAHAAMTSNLVKPRDH